MLHEVQHFCEKDWDLPPCRRRKCLLRNPPRNLCNLHELRGVRSNEPFALDNGVFRLRQHGMFLSYSGECPIPPCRRRVWPPSGQTSGLNTDRITPVTYTRYAVGLVPARCQTQTPASPAAAWYVMDLIFRPAGGESNRSSRQSHGLDTHRVTCVTYGTLRLSYSEGRSSAKFPACSTGFRIVRVLLPCYNSFCDAAPSTKGGT